jgi:hypothetical protein
MDNPKLGHHPVTDCGTGNSHPVGKQAGPGVVLHPAATTLNRDFPRMTKTSAGE